MRGRCIPVLVPQSRVLTTHPELDSLAVDRRMHAPLLESMNGKLNALLDAEAGQDLGQMLPPRVDGGWVATDATRDV